MWIDDTLRALRSWATCRRYSILTLVLLCDNGRGQVLVFRFHDADIGKQGQIIDRIGKKFRLETIDFHISKVLGDNHDTDGYRVYIR